MTDERLPNSLGGTTAPKHRSLPTSVGCVTSQNFHIPSYFVVLYIPIRNATWLASYFPLLSIKHDISICGIFKETAIIIIGSVSTCSIHRSVCTFHSVAHVRVYGLACTVNTWNETPASRFFIQETEVHVKTFWIQTLTPEFEIQFK